MWLEAPISFGRNRVGHGLRCGILTPISFEVPESSQVPLGDWPSFTTFTSRRPTAGLPPSTPASYCPVTMPKNTLDTSRDSNSSLEVLNLFRRKPRQERAIDDTELRVAHSISPSSLESGTLHDDATAASEPVIIKHAEESVKRSAEKLEQSIPEEFRETMGFKPTSVQGSPDVNTLERQISMTLGTFDGASKGRKAKTALGKGFCQCMGQAGCPLCPTAPSWCKCTTPVHCDSKCRFWCHFRII